MCSIPCLQPPSHALRGAGLPSSASDSPGPAQSQALTGGAAAAPLLVLSGLWQPLEGLVSSQLLHRGPLGKQHAVQELGGEKQGWGGRALPASVPQFTLCQQLVNTME